MEKIHKTNTSTPADVCFYACVYVCFQYAFLVTSVVQFAGGVVVFFGLLTSPKEVGE